VNDLRPYFDVALDAFGPRRLMAGSDWPVCLLATSYARWWETIDELVRELPEADRDAILGTNAVEVYRLQPVASICVPVRNDGAQNAFDHSRDS
jgi:L-fuconolactonase